MAFNTETEFKARFPEFSSVDDAVVTPFLTEAGLYVDTLWPEAARALGEGLYVAHALKLEGYGTTANLSGDAEAISAIANLAGVTGFKIDDLEVRLSDKLTENALKDPMRSTAYGRRFIELRDKFFGGGLWAS